MLWKKLVNAYKSYGFLKTLSLLKNRFHFSQVKHLYIVNKIHDSLSKDNLWQLPTYLQIEPTNQCNLDCIGCNRKELSNYGRMSLSNFQQIIDQFDDLRMVKLQGMGEPLLNPDFFPMLELLKKRGIKTYCTTNGTLLDEKRRPLMGELCDIIEISLDSSDENQLGDLRKGLEFNDLLSKIKKLSELGTNKEIKINYVLMDENIYQLPHMVPLLKKIGVRYLNVIEIQNWNPEDTDLIKLRASKEKKSILEKYRVDALKEGVFLCYEEKIEKYNECPWFKSKCFITWDGYVTPCCLRPNPVPFNMGNIFNTNISRIWNNREYLNLRQALSNEKPTSLCRNCSYIGNTE